MKTVVITGASGLLGRAILSKFLNSNSYDKVIGTAFSRSGENLVKVDLTDLEQIEKFVQETRPDVLIHSAAQRFPDKMQKDPEAARKLNVEATRALAIALSNIIFNRIRKEHLPSLNFAAVF